MICEYDIKSPITCLNFTEKMCTKHIKNENNKDFFKR